MFENPTTDAQSSSLYAVVSLEKYIHDQLLDSLGGKHSRLLAHKDDPRSMAMGGNRPAVPERLVGIDRNSRTIKCQHKRV